LLGTAAGEAPRRLGARLLLGQGELHLREAIESFVDWELALSGPAQSRQPLKLVSRQVLKRAAAARVVFVAWHHHAKGDELVDRARGASSRCDGPDDGRRSRDTVATGEHLCLGCLHGEPVDVYVPPLIETD